MSEPKKRVAWLVVDRCGVCGAGDKRRDAMRVRAKADARWPNIKPRRIIKVTYPWPQKEVQS